MARYFDLYYNSGNFLASVRRVLTAEGVHGERNPFQSFRAFADWLHRTLGQTHQIALSRQYQALFRYLEDSLKVDPLEAARTLLTDYDRDGVRRERLEFLRRYEPLVGEVASAGRSHGAKRTGSRRTVDEGLSPGEGRRSQS
jgi:hypothetical protein